VASAPTPLIGIVGWKGAGKTTLIEKLLAALRERGLTVATLKHTHHALREPDGTTDGERHALAGASRVAVVGPDAWELAGVRQASPPPSLEAAAAHLGSADLILVEGFKSACIPKIEVRRQTSERSLATSDAHVIAIAADPPLEAGDLPVFALDDVDAIATFLAAYLRDSSRPQLSQENHAGRALPAFHRRRK